ncbi:MULTISPECIES: hypothetical protein [Streptomyces]|uniref:hypothetical protein n=1 Tax=Streptomyces TaxID=1883 RepID=UPI0019658224|nr:MULTISPECIES: hypothetical protein [Streptomyces]QRX94963.1 hypothetical protein JNO44_32790 [Streptomyces noursei]UJB46200.1 hypothetical protein HRD51_40575 [Streptomyces sp. A1-5]
MKQYNQRGTDAHTYTVLALTLIGTAIGGFTFSAVSQWQGKLLALIILIGWGLGVRWWSRTRPHHTSDTH